MQTVTVPKIEYKRLIEDHKMLKFQMMKLEQFVLESTRDDVKPTVVKRLERLSREIDQGKGKFFKSWKDTRAYLDKL